ncbi:MAG: uroporphyrinogen-III synthase [Hydrogenophaga sp.]
MTSATDPSAGAGPVLRQLIVTRPAREAADWVSRLQAAGWPALALPLIRIDEPRSASARTPLDRCRAQWADYDALMFVSGEAVRHFFSAPAIPPVPPANRTRFWAPGPGTARALAAALTALGLAPDRIDVPPADAGQFDSESLWPVVAPQLRSGTRVLIVRGASVGDASQPAVTGGTGRDWLIRQCEQAGASVRSVAAYERLAPLWGPAEQAIAQQGQAPGSVWLFSSSEALDHLLLAEPRACWGGAQALVTHPRIATRAREAGFGQVLQTRPALDDVVRTLESRWSHP